MNLRNIKLDEGALKFEKLRLETFKNIQKYGELTLKALREAKIKLFLINLGIILFVVGFISILTLIFYGLLGNDTNLTQRLFTMAVVSIMVLIPLEIWIHRNIYTVEKDHDPKDETSDSIDEIKTVLKKVNDNSLIGRFLRFSIKILEKLKLNLQRHDLVANITSGIYTMCVSTLFKIEKYPEGPYSTLENYIENNAPEEFVKLYYESKEELSHIVENIRNNDYSSLAKEDADKIDRLGKIVTTDIILLKMIQLFCHEGCITIDECDKIIEVKGDEHKDAYEFFFTCPLNTKQEFSFPTLNFD